LPSGSDYVSQQTYDAFKTAFFSNSYGATSALYFYDIARGWPVILVAVLFSVLLGYSYLVILKYLGGVMIWISLGLTVAILFSSGFYTYYFARL
jgi:hypothetical protein